MLQINLKGKKAFIAGIADDQGYGWAIAKCLAEAGAEILVGTWTPLMKIFTTNLASGKLDESRKLSDGSLMQIAKIYPLDAVYDKPEDVPLEIKENKRYKDASGYTISEVAAAITWTSERSISSSIPSPMALKCKNRCSAPPARDTSRPSALQPIPSSA